MLDSAGEFGWQLERAGLSGDGAGVPIWGDSGSRFGAFDPGWQVGKAPGLREPPTSAGTLQEKQRKCCNELNLTTDKGKQTQNFLPNSVHLIVSVPHIIQTLLQLLL